MDAFNLFLHVTQFVQNHLESEPNILAQEVELVGKAGHAYAETAQ